MGIAALADGSSTVVVTPHQRDVMLKSSVAQVHALRTAVEAAVPASTAGRKLKVLTGMECHIEPDLPEWIRRGAALTLNETRFVLAEPPVSGWPPYIDAVLGQLLATGLSPVLAHPERNIVMQRDPVRLQRLVASGINVQITAGSLTGAFGPAIRATTIQWLKMGLVHYVASDAHAPGGDRSPKLSDASTAVVELVGETAARLLFEDNPTALLDGRSPGQLGPMNARR